MNEALHPLADGPPAGMSLLSPGTRQTAKRILALADQPMSRQQVALAADRAPWLANFEVTSLCKQGLVRRCGGKFYIRRRLHPADVPAVRGRPSPRRAATAHLFRGNTRGHELPLSVGPDGLSPRCRARPHAHRQSSTIT